MSEVIQTKEMPLAGIEQSMNVPFISIGYDYVRIGKAFAKQDVEYLKSICNLAQNKRGDWKYHLKSNNKISFQIHGTLVFLCICPPKLLRSENVELASQDEMLKALNKVVRESGFSFWNGYVRELHFTTTIQTPQPFNSYRSLLQTPNMYSLKEEECGRYYNSKRIVVFFYDKAEECKGKYSPALLSKFSGTFKPELFRAEVRITKEVRKVLVSSKLWDVKKTEFRASDLVGDETFCCLTRYLEKLILRFLKPIKIAIPKKIISDNTFVRASCATDEGYLAIAELHEKGLLSDEMLRRSTEYHNESKEQQRNDYLRKHLSQKVTSVLAEYLPKRRIDATAKQALEKLSRNSIISLPR